MLFFEAFIKFGAIGLLIALGLLMVRHARQILALRIALLLNIAMIFMFLTTGSQELMIQGPIAIPMRLFDMLNSIFIWWLGLCLFDDDFKLGPREWLVAVAYVCIAMPVRLHYLGFDLYWTYSMNIAMSIFSLLLMIHLAYLALVGHKEDLVEKRRRVRLWFVVAIAVVVVASIVAERIAGYIGIYEAETIWVTYLFTFPIALWAILWLARLHPEMLAFARRQLPEIEADSMSVKDKAAYKKLLEAMESEQAFQNQGLSIGDLAATVGLPSHQLRKLINQTMGYRNFSSFLNFYRIRAVKQSLTDPEKTRIPVLTLAMDAGFSSLAPFNRAFKASEKLTPSDYRNQFLSEAPKNAVQN